MVSESECGSSNCFRVVMFTSILFFDQTVNTVNIFLKVKIIRENQLEREALSYFKLLVTNYLQLMLLCLKDDQSNLN